VSDAAREGSHRGCPASEGEPFVTRPGDFGESEGAREFKFVPLLPQKQGAEQHDDGNRKPDSEQESRASQSFAVSIVARALDDGYRGNALRATRHRESGDSQAIG
jgi:hypothetical protein